MWRSSALLFVAAAAASAVLVPGGSGSFVEVSGLPSGPFAPTVIPKAPQPFWSWDRIPRSFHGAVKDREFTDEEVALLATFQMV
jgi:hypothetical protein